MGTSGQVGFAIFTAISIAALGFCLMAGPFLTADTLTSEKREGTLGLLFLTDLRPFDIVSGKLAAASLNALLAFLSTVPLLMLPVMWGGVSLKQVLLTVLALALALGVSLAAGLFYSTVCRHHRLALLATLTTIILLAGLPLAACRWLPRGLREEETHTTIRRRRSVRPRKSDEAHPFWLAGRDSATRAFMFWITVSLGVGCLALISISVAKGKDDLLAVAIPVAYCMHLLLKCLFAAETTDRFYHDRTTGHLELLLTTPCPPETILSGHWAGLRQRFGAARVFLIFINCVLVLALCTEAGPNPGDELVWIAGLVVAGMVFLYLDCRALFWTGLDCALKARGAGRALGGAVGRILLPGWVAVFFFFFAGMSNLLRDESSIHALLLCWLAAFVTWDLAVAKRHRTRIGDHLRELASEQHASA
jgi:ABC-type transport system involved in multi-copper enzyme maturation permease subunit